MDITKLEMIRFEFQHHENFDQLGLVPSEQADHFEPVTTGRFFSHDLLDHPRRETMEEYGFLGTPTRITGELQAHGVLGWGLMETGHLGGKYVASLDSWLSALSRNFVDDFQSGHLVFEPYEGPYPFPENEQDRSWIFKDENIQKSKEIFKEENSSKDTTEEELNALLEENHILIWQWIYHGYKVAEQYYECQFTYIKVKELIENDFNKFFKNQEERTWAGCNVEVDFRFHPYVLNFRREVECNNCYCQFMIPAEDVERYEFCESCREEQEEEEPEQEDD